MKPASSKLIMRYSIRRSRMTQLIGRGYQTRNFSLSGCGAVAFDYTDNTDDETARRVAAEMSGAGLAPLTPEQELEREEWRRDYLARQEQERIAAEQHRLAAEQHRLAQEREREAVAERAAKAERERAQRERAQEIDRQVTQRSLSDLRLQSAQQSGWQRDVTRAMQNQAAYQARHTLLNELESMLTPPPLPEPSVVVVEADQEDDTFCGVKVTRPNPRRSWW